MSTLELPAHPWEILDPPLVVICRIDDTGFVTQTPYYYMRLSHTHNVMTGRTRECTGLRNNTDTYSFTQPAESTQQHRPAVRSNKTCTCMARYKSPGWSVAGFGVDKFASHESWWYHVRKMPWRGCSTGISMTVNARFYWRGCSTRMTLRIDQMG